MTGDEPEDDEPVDETPNAADPVSQAEQRKHQKNREDRYTEFWKRVLADQVGREVMYQLMADCGTFSFPVAATPAGFPDREQTWFLLGKKSIGEALRDRLELADYQALHRMYEEYHPKFMKPKPARRKKPDGE